MVVDKISSFCGTLGNSLASLVRVALMSKRVDKLEQVSAQREMVILGNGPSLRSLLDDHPEYLKGKDLMAVNFAANTPEFQEFKPKHYVLADPHFFNQDSGDPNVKTLWDNICGVNYPMILHVPVKMKSHPFIQRYLARRNGHRVEFFNLTPAEGFRWWRNWLYKRRWATPRPRNVMIPSIMQSLALGYKKIYLAGADHSWSRSLSVDDNNHVVSIQPHFYKDGEEEQKRVSNEYAGYHLHDILKSLYTAFSSYHLIADYALRQNAEIINITPGSFIDAFPRQKL